jgi:tetratricopeptide (TPR) repeat protein
MSRKNQPGSVVDDPIAVMPLYFETFKNALFTRFLALIDAGEYREAITLRQQVLTLYEKGSDNHGRVCGRLARCYWELGMLDEALSYVNKAREIFPEDVPASTLLARIYMSTGKIPAALEMTNQAVSTDPTSADALHTRAMALIGMAALDNNRPPDQRQVEPRTRVEQAIADMKQCVEQDPVNTTYLSVLATAWAMLDEYQRAVALLDKALRIKPGDPFLLSLRARAQGRESFWFESMPE